MIYRLNDKKDYLNYMTTTLTEVGGEPLEDQWSFDDSTGIIKVNSSGSKGFYINVPIRNLKIGDKIKISADVKLISGNIRPQIATSLGYGSGATLYGSEGKNRVISQPKITIRDFQNISLSATYEGYQYNSLEAPSYNSIGVLYARFAFYSGYGAGAFQFKNLTIETEQNISGLYPGTRIYYGRTSLDKTSGLSLSTSGNSNNFGDLNISSGTDGGGFFYKINTTPGFYKSPTMILTPYFQSTGNARKYELLVSSTTVDYVMLRIYDMVNKVFINDISTLTESVYTGFLLIGE